MFSSWAKRHFFLNDPNFFCKKSKKALFFHQKVKKAFLAILRPPPSPKKKSATKNKINRTIICDQENVTLVSVAGNR